MSDTLPEIPMKIIGTVRNDVKEPGGGPGSPRIRPDDIISEIVLDESLSGSLDSLDTYDYVTVIYYLHKHDQTIPKTPRVHPHNNPEKSK